MSYTFVLSHPASNVVYTYNRSDFTNICLSTAKAALPHAVKVANEMDDDAKKGDRTQQQHPPFSIPLKRPPLKTQEYLSKNATLSAADLTDGRTDCVSLGTKRLLLPWKDGAAAAKQARNTRTGSDEENWKNIFGKLNLSFGILIFQREKERKEIVGANKAQQHG